MIQSMIFDTAAEIQACRLLTLDAAQKIDRGDPARVEIGLIKVVGAKMLHEAIDRAIQVFGAKGVTVGHAARAHVPPRALRAHLRRPGRGASRDRRAPAAARVQEGPPLELRLRRRVLIRDALGPLAGAARRQLPATGPGRRRANSSPARQAGGALASAISMPRGSGRLPATVSVRSQAASAASPRARRSVRSEARPRRSPARGDPSPAPAVSAIRV